MAQERAEMIEETRAKLISAARAAFATVGYADSSMDELTAQAGLTRGALYHHFGDRKGLIKAAAAVVGESLVAAEDPGHLEAGFTASTHEEFCDYIVGQLRRAATSEENRARRAQRVRLAAAGIVGTAIALDLSKQSNEGFSS